MPRSPDTPAGCVETYYWARANGSHPVDTTLAMQLTCHEGGVSGKVLIGYVATPSGFRVFCADAAKARHVQVQAADGLLDAVYVAIGQSHACDDLKLHQLEGEPSVLQFERIEDISVLTLVAVHRRARQPIVAPLVYQIHRRDFAT